MKAPEAYAKLIDLSAELQYIGAASSLLSWDQETYMPEKGTAFRAEQLAYLGGLSHEKFTAPAVNDWIQCCEDDPFEDPVKSVNVREWRRDYDRSTKIPTALVEESNRASALGRKAWLEARAASDFSLFKDSLAKLIEIEKKKAEHWGYEHHIYDALLHGYEPEARTSEIQETFAELQPAISGLIPEILSRQEANPPASIKDHYPVDQQIAFNRMVAEAFGFDFEAGRIDTTAHPFCTGLGPNDTRLTTRYDEEDFTSSLYGVVHETGHGLYDQGLLEEHAGTPMGSSVSLGIHESQSRLWENKVARTKTFWNQWFDIACEHFPNLRKFTVEQVIQHTLKTEPSFIRVEADEMTYDLHIILRFEMELAIFSGEITVDDIPSAWNERFEKMFHLKVPNDKNGCLQDIHWSMGGFGYFPTYTLGNLNSAQLFRRALTDIEGLEDQLRSRKYKSLLKWLNEKVHEPGRSLAPQDLMESATGEKTQAGYHLEYLRSKYLG